MPRPEGRGRLVIERVGTARFGHGVVPKLMSYAGFYLGATWKSLLGSRSDVVVTMTTPPLLGLIGWAAQTLHGSRHYIWEMDVYPDVAVELGTFRRGGWRDQVVGWLADLPRRKADGVIALGPCMAERLIRRGVPAEKIVVAPNWADGAEIRPRPFVKDGRLKVLYSGNLGLAHDVETFRGAAEGLARRRRWFQNSFLFRFAGGGPQRKDLVQWAQEEGFANVEFSGYAPRAALGDSLGACDVGLVTQKAETVGTVVPSKAYGIWAAGRGVLYVGPREGTIGRVIAEHGVGWQVDHGDARGLAGLLCWLAESPEVVEETGRRARTVFEREFDLPVGVRRVWRALGVEIGVPVDDDFRARPTTPA